jgi:hypothetical protein
MPGFFRRHANAIPLIAGFLFGMAGGIWSFTVDRRLGEELAELTDAKADHVDQVRTLNQLASDYFTANQLGDLIFATAHRSEARVDLVQLIYKGELIDRTTPVRSMIGALAMAGQLDYRATYDAYVKVNEAARDHFALDTFRTLKRTEAEIIDKGQKRVPVLVKEASELDKKIAANKQAQRKNGAVGLVSSLLGGFLLLLANLMATGQRDETPAGART